RRHVGGDPRAAEGARAGGPRGRGGMEGGGRRAGGGAPVTRYMFTEEAKTSFGAAEVSHYGQPVSEGGGARSACVIASPAAPSRGARTPPPGPTTRRSSTRRVAGAARCSGAAGSRAPHSSGYRASRRARRPRQ